jgi:hypothetical protein
LNDQKGYSHDHATTFSRCRRKTPFKNLVAARRTRDWQAIGLPNNHDLGPIAEPRQRSAIASICNVQSVAQSSIRWLIKFHVSIRAPFQNAILPEMFFAAGFGSG